MASPPAAPDGSDSPGVVAARRALALLDQQAAGLRDELVRLRQSLTDTRQDLNESRLAQLREANQKLVLSALHADSIARQAMANLAELNLSHQRDALTGMPNRALLLDRLENAIVMARQHRRQLALLFIDLDHFKIVNDSLGHAGGDEALKLVAQRLHSALHGSDTVCRYGGDEFLVLLPEVPTAAYAAQVAEDILAALAVPGKVGAIPLNFSASIGISIYPEDGEDADTLIDRADAAMYLAKKHALCRFAFHGQYATLGGGLSSATPASEESPGGRNSCRRGRCLR